MLRGKRSARLLLGGAVRLRLDGSPQPGSIIYVARAPYLEVPISGPDGTLSSLAIELPRRPHFILRWKKAGQLPESLALPRDFFLGQGRGIYVVFAVDGNKTRVQYVGMTFDQSVAGRLSQHIDSLFRLGASLAGKRYLYGCWVEPVKYKTLSRKMLAEIENYLIWAMKPEGNRARPRRYQGRPMLIENAGDSFGLPRFLFVAPIGWGVAVGQGASLEGMTSKFVRGGR